jgi:hypothetical protein
VRDRSTSWPPTLTVCSARMFPSSSSAGRPATESIPHCSSQCARAWIAREGRKAPRWLWIAVSADGGVELARPHIDTGCIWMQYRQRVESSLTPLGHLLLRGCRPDARGNRANSQSRSVPETGKRHHMSVRNPRPTLFDRASIEHQCRRVVAAIRGHQEYLRSTRVRLHPVWPGPVACLRGVTPEFGHRGIWSQMTDLEGSAASKRLVGHHRTRSLPSTAQSVSDVWPEIPSSTASFSKTPFRPAPRRLVAWRTWTAGVCCSRTTKSVGRAHARYH